MVLTVGRRFYDDGGLLVVEGNEGRPKPVVYGTVETPDGVVIVAKEPSRLTECDVRIPRRYVAVSATKNEDGSLTVAQVMEV